MVAQTSNVNLTSRRGRMRKSHETVIATIRPTVTKRTEQLLSQFLRELVPVIEESVIAQTRPPVQAEKQEDKKRERKPRKQQSKLYQAEKLLQRLIKGDVVSMKDLKKDLRKEIEVYRMSAYLWDLKQWGAEVIRHKKGRKIVALQLKNAKEMETYLQKRMESQQQVAA